MPTRRRFLELSSAALACASAPRLLLAQQRQGIPVFSNAASGAAQQGTLTAASFQKLVGTPFRVFLNDNAVADIVLRKVKIPTYLGSATGSTATGTPARPGAGVGPTAARRTTGGTLPTNVFMLIFATGSLIIPQDSYILDNGTFGSFNAFLVPAQSVPGNQLSIATFCFYS